MLIFLQCTEDGCSESFHKNHQLRLHISQVHAPPGSKPFICDYEGCSKSFSTNQHLRTHKKTHDRKSYLIEKNLALMIPSSQSIYLRATSMSIKFGRVLQLLPNMVCIATPH